MIGPLMIGASVILKWVLPPDDERDLRDLVTQLGLREQPVSLEWQCETLRLTAEYPETLYGASYHALAIVNDETFVTGDGKYLQAVAGEWHIRHLQDWS